MRPFLMQQGKVLATNPQLLMRIEGHADQRGTDGHNDELSRRRAEGEAGEVVRAGAKSVQLTVAGFGSRRPIRTGGSPEELAHNRHVELLLLEPLQAEAAAEACREREPEVVPPAAVEDFVPRWALRRRPGERGSSSESMVPEQPRPYEGNTMAHVPMTRLEALTQLAARGIRGPMVYLLDALPLVEMAWADGEVQPAERAMILSFVDQHLTQLDAQAQTTVVPRRQALEFINRYLVERPTAAEFSTLRELMMVMRLTGENAEAQGQRILDGASSVAAAAPSPTKPHQSWDKEELVTLWDLEASLRSS